MSLLSDPDYITHALRLTYLRHVDDPYGNRIISFDPRYNANPYVRAAGLADPDLWPQLTQPESPKPVESVLAPPGSPTQLNTFVNGRAREDDPVAPEAGMYPGANLKYSETIMGPSRTGIAGMRVSGRRMSANRGTPSRSTTALTESQQPARYRSDSAPTPVPGSDNPLNSHTFADPAPVNAVPTVDDERAQRRGSGGSTHHSITIPPVDPTASTGTTPTATIPTRLGSDSLVPSQVQAQTPPSAPAFNLPIFARAAEMEERRQQRLMKRFVPRFAPNPINPATLEPSPALQPMRNGASAPRRAADAVSLSGTIDSRTSREEDASGTIDGEGDGTVALDDSDDDESDDDGDGDGDADPDEMDAEMAESGDVDDLSVLFNPTFTTNTVGASTGSDEHSFLSGNSTNSLPQPHSQPFAPPLPRPRSRLSPVTEVAASENAAPPARQTPQSTRIPMPRPTSIHSPPAPLTPRASVVTRSRAYSSAPGFRVPSPEEPPMTFTRQQVPQRAPNSSRSALTEALAARSTVSDNPFSELYGAISGRAEQGAVPFTLWFPHANKVKSKDRRGRTIEKPFSLEVKVRKDATAEELIGFGLWAYWESEQEPRLDEGIQNMSQAEKDARLSSAGWNLVMFEDGEVDTDLNIARTQTMMQLKSFEELAIVEATPEQVQQNLAAEASIARRPSRLMAMKPRQDSNTGGGLAPPGVVAGATGPVTMMSSSDIVTSNLLTGVSIGNTTSAIPGGPAIFLKIKVAAKADVHYSTTINVSADTYMADVLEQVCRKRRLQDAKEWALMTENPAILIPLDRTVASLKGTKELLLVKRSLLDGLGLVKPSRVPRSSDPNASIFELLEDANPGRGFNSSRKYEEVYKKYTVHRKIPMLVGRHERIIAIDGDYIHIMPSSNRAFLDTMKTSSYHIKTVIGCKTTKKAPTSIKLVVRRDGGSKRYDFEAEDEKQAGEIVETIKNLQKQYTLDRTGTLGKSKTVKRPKISTR
ncbi:stress-activated map kinase-interacting protein [Ceratobasidium sp. AG-Ba]|nr:stress-activated map kinase-interacting protein [Ceratobasidium sp. AG-Ba]